MSAILRRPGYSEFDLANADFSRPAAGANADGHARVESIADAVAEEVEAQDGEEQGRAWAEDHPGRLLEVAAAGVDHAAPRWLRRLHAQAKKRQRRLGQDREANAQ